MTPLRLLKNLQPSITGHRKFDADGSFPNHIPNPEDPDAMDAIIATVNDNKANVGIIFDTDVDRAGAVEKIAACMQAFLGGFDSLDVPEMS